VFENSSPTFTIDVFPNPAHQFIQLNLPERFETKGAILNIYAISGLLIAKSTFATVVDISTLSSGTYFLEIQNLEKIVKGKFVVD
jgi:hypothetical protein